MRAEGHSNRAETSSNRADGNSIRAETHSNRAEGYSNRLCPKTGGNATARERVFNVKNTLPNGRVSACIALI